MMVSELESRMSYKEFQRWVVFFSLEGGFPTQREDLHFARLSMFQAAQVMKRPPRMESLYLIQEHLTKEHAPDVPLVEHTQKDVDAMARLVANMQKKRAGTNGRN